MVVPVASLSVQLPTSVPEKAVENGPDTGFCHSCGMPNGAVVPWFQPEP